MIQLKDFEEMDAFALHELSMHPYFYKRRLARFLYPDTFINTISIIQGYQSADSKRFIIQAIWKEDCLCGFIQAEKKTASSCELSYWVGYPYWNQGIATQAVFLMCKQAFTIYPITRIYGRVFMDNLASIKVLKKNHFQKGVVLDQIVIYEKFK